MKKSISNSQIDYTEHIVAFVDILGFSNLIDSIEDDKKLHDRLHWALTHIRSYKELSLVENTAQSDLKVSVFSDCIVVTGKKNNFHGVIWAVGWLQTQLLGAGILTRGGISSGKVVHADEILYGKGMLKAYKIENSAAVYPRIVIDPDLVMQIPDTYKSIFLALESDGLYFIDPFAFTGTWGDVVAQVEDGWDSHAIYLDEVEKHIQDGIRKASSVDHKSKWTWLAARHAIAKKEYVRTRETKLSQILKKMPNQAFERDSKKRG